MSISVCITCPHLREYKIHITYYIYNIYVVVASAVFPMHSNTLKWKHAFFSFRGDMIE